MLEELDSLIETLNQKGSFDYDNLYKIGDRVVNMIIRLGRQARLRAISESYPIHEFDPNRRIWVVSYLIGCDPSQWGGMLDNKDMIPLEALTVLTKSHRYEDWFCFFQLSFKFEEHVPRGVLKSGFLEINRKCSEEQCEEVSYWLKKRGFVPVGPFWI